MERETGFEPATNSLEGCDSTPELLPLVGYLLEPTAGAGARRRSWWRREDSNLRRAKPGRFTVCCHCPLGHTSKELPALDRGGWSRHPDLNRGPTVYKTVALPLSYAGPGSPLIQEGPGAPQSLAALPFPRKATPGTPPCRPKPAADLKSKGSWSSHTQG